MAYTRLGQITAETQTTSEYVVYNGETGPTLSSTKANTGTYSFRHGVSEYPAGLGFTSTTQIRAGYYLNHNGQYTSDSEPILFAWETPDGLDFIEWDATTGLLRLTVDSSVVASISAASAGITATDTWYHLGLTLFTNAVTGWVSFYVDGTQTLTWSGDTSTGVTAVYTIGRGVGLTDAGFANYAYFDDFYVDDAVGESDLAPQSKRFLWSIADGNGTDSAWTGSDADSVNNYLLVDDAPPDDDTTYVKAASSTLKDGYTTGNITVPDGWSIIAAIPTVYAKKSDAGTDTEIKLYSYDGATYQTGTAQDLATAYGFVFERQTTQPDATDWNETDFNSMEFGIESAGSF